VKDRRYADAAMKKAKLYEQRMGKIQQMKRRDIVGREVTFGAPIPRGWRMAWYEPQKRVAVYFPTPLHWLAGAAREIVWRIGIAWNVSRRERHESQEMQRTFRERQRLAEEYAAGYLVGWHECLDACLEALECNPQSGNLHSKMKREN
jgi:hypothetical protein